MQALGCPPAFDNFDGVVDCLDVFHKSQVFERRTDSEFSAQLQQFVVMTLSQLPVRLIMRRTGNGKRCSHGCGLFQLPLRSVHRSGMFFPRRLKPTVNVYGRGDFHAVIVHAFANLFDGAASFNMSSHVVVPEFDARISSVGSNGNLGAEWEWS